MSSRFARVTLAMLVGAAVVGCAPNDEEEPIALGEDTGPGDVESEVSVPDGTAPDATSPDGGTDAGPDGRAQCPDMKDCSGRECGPDPVCGASCGSCGPQSSCEEGQCVCQPDCSGKRCGGDGCGGSCGECFGPEACTADGTACERECVASDGSPVEVDVPRVEVQLQVTLDGQPLDGSRTDNVDYGVIFLRAQNPGKPGVVAETWAGFGEGAQGTFDVPVVPGTYDVGYRYSEEGAGGEADEWPQNRGILMEDVEITADRSLTVDVPRVETTLEWTIDGEAVGPSNTSETDSGFFKVRGRDSLGDMPVFSSWDHGLDEIQKQHELVLLPGEYDVEYRGNVERDVDEELNSDSTHWPVNSGMLREGIDLTSSRTVEVDVPTSEVTLDWQLDGRRISESETSASDEGELQLVNPRTGASDYFGSAWNGSDDSVQRSFTQPVLPGTYDLRYVADPAGNARDDDWPQSSGRLRESLDFSSNASVSVDVPTSRAEIEVTLDGEPVTTSNTGSENDAKLYLHNPRERTNVLLGDVWNDETGQPQDTFTTTMFPGEYELHYEGSGHLRTGWPDNGWPGNSGALRQGIDLSEDRSTTVDIPTVEATITVTLDGETAAEASADSEKDDGHLYLRDTVSGRKTVLAKKWNPGASEGGSTVERRMLPGTYDFTYNHSLEVEPREWPRNAGTLREGVTIEDDRSLSVDVPVARAAVDVTLAGEPVQSANTGENDQGKLSLADPESGDGYRFELVGNDSRGHILGDVWIDHEMRPRDSFRVPLLPGSYDIFYANHRRGEYWPLNRTTIECINLQ